MFVVVSVPFVRIHIIMITILIIIIMFLPIQWSFAVLVWELFTFADQPYFDIEVSEMVEHLARGFRLAQPTNCPDDM